MQRTTASDHDLGATKNRLLFLMFGGAWLCWLENKLLTLPYSRNNRSSMSSLLFFWRGVKGHKMWLNDLSVFGGPLITHLAGSKFPPKINIYLVKFLFIFMMTKNITSGHVVIPSQKNITCIYLYNILKKKYEVRFD